MSRSVATVGYSLDHAALKNHRLPYHLFQVNNLKGGREGVAEECGGVVDG